jgi:hypothetical protein
MVEMSSEMCLNEEQSRFVQGSFDVLLRTPFVQKCKMRGEWMFWSVAAVVS